MSTYIFMYHFSWQFKLIKKDQFQHKRNKIQEPKKKTRHMIPFSYFMIQSLNVGNIHFYIWNCSLPPKLRVFQIDLKVWGSLRRVVFVRRGQHFGGTRWGWKFYVGRTGFCLMGEHGWRNNPTHKSKYFKNHP